jgi:CHASE1-domain containing sensor protein
MIIPKIKKGLPYIVLVVILFTGTGLSILASTATQKLEIQKLRISFNRAAENRYASLEREIKANLYAVESLQAFYLSSEKISRSEFRDFTKALLLQKPGMGALEWIPRVPYFQRKEYEKAAKKEWFPNVQITEEDAQGKMIRAIKREEYFPVYFVEPFEANKITLGFDLAASLARKESLEKSRDTGEIVATGLGTLVHDTPAQHGFADGFLVFAPVYKKGVPIGSVQARRDNLRGFALGVFRIGELVEGALAYLESEGIDLYIYDQSSPKGKRFLYFSQSPLHKTAVSPMSDEEINSFNGIKYANTIDVAGREWLMLAIPIPECISAGKTRLPQGVLAAGFLLTGLLVSYLWVNIRHAEVLRKSEERYKSLFDSTLDGIYQTDATGVFTVMNRAGAKIFGYECPDEIIGKNALEYWRDPKDRDVFRAKLQVKK